MRTPKPLPRVSTIEHHYTYSIITGEFYYNTPFSGGKRGELNDIAGSVSRRGRRYIGIKGKVYQASRLAWKVVYGTDPVHVIDHIDNDPLNNSIINLRDVTQHMNSLNRVDTKKNGGVYVDKVRKAERRRTDPVYREKYRIESRDAMRRMRERQRKANNNEDT